MVFCVQPFFQRGSKPLHSVTSTSAVIAEFEELRDRLEEAFCGVKIAIDAGTSLSELVIDFYEGNAPPYLADLNTYGFYDAAGFPNGEDRDVIFKVSEAFPLWTSGVRFIFLYSMSTFAPTKNIQLRLDYRVHNEGEIHNLGTAYDSTILLSPTAALDTLAVFDGFVIPNGHVIANTVEVECRLTRQGSVLADDHGGDFGLKAILATTI